MKSQRNARGKTLLNGKRNSEPIPIDLIIEILSRLPLKSIGRCRCVSKLWASIVRLPYFTELFFTRSSARPHLLFAYKKDSELLFFSLSQPQNPHHEKSPPLAVKLLTRFPVGDSSYETSGHVHGLVFLRYRDDTPISKELMMPTQPVQIICNPSTGQALTLPKVNTMIVGLGSNIIVKSYLGHDPIDKKFKVLSITWDSKSHDRQYQVLTLGAQKLEWRMIECCIPHYSWLKGICINGVLYYPTYTGRNYMIACFYVRSEKFSYIKVETTFKTAVFQGALINYNGKLGSLISHGSSWASRVSKSFELLVIGDFEKQEWSTHKYVLPPPPMWKNVVGQAVLHFSGVIGTNEIVLSDRSQVIYYNTEKNTFAKVGIRGMEAFQCYSCSAFLDHVEDLKLMEAF